MGADSTVKVLKDAIWSAAKNAEELERQGKDSSYYRTLQAQKEAELQIATAEYNAELVASSLQKAQKEADKAAKREQAKSSEDLFGFLKSEEYRERREERLERMREQREKEYEEWLYEQEQAELRVAEIKEHMKSLSDDALLEIAQHSDSPEISDITSEWIRMLPKESELNESLQLLEEQKESLRTKAEEILWGKYKGNVGFWDDHIPCRAFVNSKGDITLEDYISFYSKPGSLLYINLVIEEIEKLEKKRGSLFFSKKKEEEINDLKAVLEYSFEYAKADHEWLEGYSELETLRNKIESLRETIDDADTMSDYAKEELRARGIEVGDLNREKLLWETILDTFGEKGYKSGYVWPFQAWNSFRNMYNISMEEWHDFIQKKCDLGFFEKTFHLTSKDDDVYDLKITEHMENAINAYYIP